MTLVEFCNFCPRSRACCYHVAEIFSVACGMHSVANITLRIGEFPLQ